ncbi:MAG: hypothetical protein ACYC96_09650 [Fimbriimonadaceae bacterium]
MVLALFAAFLWSAPQNRQPIKTDFLPSRDLPHFKNVAGPFSSSTAKNGLCNGIDELATAYLQVRKNNPNAMPLSEISETIRKYHGDAYLKATMATATYMAYSKGDVMVNLQRDPNAFVGAVIAKLQTSQEPQSILLTQPDGGSHRVTVYGATPTASGWTLNISDSNHPEPDVADHVTLSVDATTGRLTSNVPGQAAETWSEGGIVKDPARPAQQYIDMINMSIQGKPQDEIRDTEHVTEHDHGLLDLPPQAIHAQKDPEAGGVLLRFDPGLFTGAVDETKLAELNQRLGAFLQAKGGDAVILNLKPTVKRLSLVSFSSLSPHGVLGGLTRVQGFVMKPDGRVYLAGVKEPGHAPIPAEWLAVALQCQYAQGLAPYISLDPNLKTFSGPQKVRIGDIPQKLRSSSFIKAMLDADYLMKRINLGKEDPKVNGFKCWVDRMEEAGRGGAVRMWFTPYELPAADSFIYRHDGGLAVLFRSRVAVLSEREKCADETGYVAGAPDDVADGATQDLNEHFAAMSTHYPEFYRLRGVFDVSKLAACWRALKLKPGGLAKWLSFTPPPAVIPASYPGIGPDATKDGKSVVSGGAIARARFKLASTVETNRLAPMMASAGRSEVVVELPATLPLDKASEVGFRAQNLLAVAQSDEQLGQLGAALSGAEQVLALDPDDEDALTLKAIVLGFMSRFAEAIAIFNKLVPNSPGLLGIRAVLKAGAGDYAGALADARDAEAQSPDNESSLAACVAARILALDADGAAATLAKLRALSPAYPSIEAEDAQIDLIRYLGPEKARARMALQAQIPVPISLALMHSPLAPGGIAAYKKALAELQSGEFTAPAQLFIPERLILALACGTLVQPPSKDDLALLAKNVDKMIADHPTWASGYLARFCLLSAIDGPVDAISGSLDKFAELEANPDPVLSELQLLMRVHPLAPYLAAMASIDPATKPELRHEMAIMAVQLAPELPGRHFLALLVANPRVDAAALTEAMVRGVVFESTDDLTRVLDQMTATVESIPPNDPAFIPALGYCADALDLVKPDSPQYGRMIHRATTLSLAGAPSRFFEPLAAIYRGHIWMRLAFDSVRPLLSPDSPALKKMGPATDQMDRLLTPDSSRDSIPSVAKNIGALVKGLTGFVHTLRVAVGGSLSGIRTQYGAGMADIAELCVAEMQAQMHTKDHGELKKLIVLHPGIEKTASYKALVTLYKNMARGVLLSEPEDAVWRRVLTAVKTRYDGLSVQELIIALQGKGGPKSERLAKYMTQCKAKTELGTTLSGA